MTFRLLTIAHATLPRTLSCLSVKIHLRYFGGRHQEIKLSSMVLLVARTEVSVAVTCTVSPACWKPSHHQLLEKLPYTGRICSNTETVFYSATSLSVIAGVRWTSSFVFRSTRVSTNSSIAFCWLTSMHDPDWESFVQRILCPVKVTSFQSSELTWKSFLSLARTRCSISVPLFRKRLSTKRLIIPATDFPVSGLPAMGSSILSYASSTSVRTRGLFEMLPVSVHCEKFHWFKVRSGDCTEYNT